MTGITTLDTFRNERPFPFCPGCGHSSILDALDAALVRRGADPAKTVIVSDIGCSGLSDQYFSTSAFHGLHGRSITYASGIKLADPSLEVIVIMGDGGTGIGGAHLLNAARRNVRITVLVFDNLNFGMTGGQHSTTTPYGAFTTTTPLGNLERPLDIAATAAVNGAGYVWRGTSYDDDLSERIEEAMATPGFSLMDIWEPCTAYYVLANKVSRTGLAETMEALGLDAGVVVRRDVGDFSVEYRRVHEGDPAPDRPEPVDPVFSSSLNRRSVLVAAGAAGGKVRSAVRLGGIGGMLAGLWGVQRDDYPVTVKTGHSVSTLVLDPNPVEHAGAKIPSIVLAMAPEGVAKERGRLAAMRSDGLVLAEPGLVGSLETEGRVLPLDLDAAPSRLGGTDIALAFVAAAVTARALYPIDALEEAVRRAGGRHAERNLKAVAAGVAMAEALPA